MSDERNTITLRALEGEPLADDTIRRMVIAAANAIAERNGVDLLRVTAEPDHITATLRCSRLAAIGFASELRRITERWYKEHTGEHTLWGTADPGPGGPDDEDWGLRLDDWKDNDEG